MLGHVTLTALDPERAASHSPAIIDGLLRERWGYDGLLVTDDLNMGAVYNLGIGRVAGEALAAGADLVLVSYDPRQVYRAIFCAAQALERREIAPATLTESRRRIAGFSMAKP
jgi:beta-N-acetylhexosaminidase